MNKNTIIQLVIVASLVGGYFFIDTEKIQSLIYGEGEYIVQNKQCNLKETACDVTLQDGTQFTFEILQKDIPIMKPITFKLTTSNEKLDDLKVIIYATNMNMGLYELKFQNKGNGVHEAIGTLPTCPIGKMNWNADIPVQKLSQKIGARFQFKTDI